LREPEAAPCAECGWPVGSIGCTHTGARRSTNRCVVCGKHREYIAPDGLPYCAACRTPEPTGDDHKRIAADSSKRVEVEVVWMGVRHEDGVDLTDRPRIRRRADPTQGPEARAQERIGQ